MKRLDVSFYLNTPYTVGLIVFHAVFHAAEFTKRARVAVKVCAKNKKYVEFYPVQLC